MPKIKTPAWACALAVVGGVSVSVFSVMAQSAPAPSSLETVDALLQAENQSVLQRAVPSGQNAAGSAISALTAPAPTAPGPRELSVLSVYGLSSDLRIDLLYGDTVITGLRNGQRAGPVQVVAIEGACARLVVSAAHGRQEVRPCWSVYGAVPPMAGAAKPEAVRNPPVATDIHLPSLPMVPSVLGLMRGASGDKPLRVPVSPLISQ